MAKTKKTLTKENKTYWEQHGFDEELKKKLKWKDWEYEAYNTYMARQKKPKQLIGGKAPRKRILTKAARKMMVPKKRKLRYRPGTVAL